MRAIALISALAILTAVFLPWTGVAAFQGHVTPWGLIGSYALDLASAQSLIGHPPALLAILATLLMAPAFILAAALGHPSRALAILTGALILGLIGYGLWQIRQGGLDAGSFGLAIRRDTPVLEMLGAAQAGLAPGAWCWAVGGLFLLISGAIGYGARR